MTVFNPGSPPPGLPPGVSALPESAIVGAKTKIRARQSTGFGTPPAVHCSEKEEDYMHPAFWPMQAFVFWADVLMLPWKIMMAPVAESLNMAEAAASPAAAAGLDPVSPKEIGTSATDFRKDGDV